MVFDSYLFACYFNNNINITKRLYAPKNTVLENYLTIFLLWIKLKISKLYAHRTAQTFICTLFENYLRYGLESTPTYEFGRSVIQGPLITICAQNCHKFPYRLCMGTYGKLVHLLAAWLLSADISWVYIAPGNDRKSREVSDFRLRLLLANDFVTGCNRKLPLILRMQNLLSIASISDIYNLVKVSWDSTQVDENPSSPLGDEDFYYYKLSKDHLYVV